MNVYMFLGLIFCTGFLLGIGFLMLSIWYNAKVSYKFWRFDKKPRVPKWFDDLNLRIVLKNDASRK